MLTFEKVFKMDNEKQVAKIEKGLMNGRGLELLNAFLSETKHPNAMDLRGAQVVLTENYICYYGQYKQNMYILPLSSFVNVYSSNCFYGNYDYNCKAIALETDTNETFYISKCMRNQKVADFNQVIKMVEERCRQNENSLIA